MLAESIGVSFAPNYGPSISSEQKLRKGASILCQAMDRLERDRQFLDENDVTSLRSRYEELVFPVVQFIHDIHIITACTSGNRDSKIPATFCGL